MKPVKRILLDDQQSLSIIELMEGLRKDSCKTDASKIVNEIIALYFRKYASTEYRFLKEKFFDKKSYLKQLISSTNSDEIDESIKKYLALSASTKKRGRKPKSAESSVIDEITSS